MIAAIVHIETTIAHIAATIDYIITATNHVYPFEPTTKVYEKMVKSFYLNLN